jgi:hypothetical protein
MQTRAFSARVGLIFKESYRLLKRQNPTRIPYSCHAQFGTSGSNGTPVGAGITCLAMGLDISQTSKLTILQTMTFAPPGNFSGGRSTIAENGALSEGCIDIHLLSITELNDKTENLVE